MLGKVKLFFGIEGLKIDLDIPATFNIDQKNIEGSLRLHSKTYQKIKKIKVLLSESYERGRGKNKRTNDYSWGKIELSQIIEIPANTEKIIDFTLTIAPQQSKMDALESRNILLKKLAGAAKWINGAKSEFNITVSVDIDGVGLNPSISKPISLA